MIPFTILLYVAVLPASLATSSQNYTTPQKIELDLVFPQECHFRPHPGTPLTLGSAKRRLCLGHGYEA
ncbi:hypothetical protein BDW75DRAFT_218086 [Aspergillus navahoensis]